MRVVTNTSPLRYLILTGYIDLLPTLYEHILIPRAVADELQRPSTPALVKAWIQQPPSWCVIQSPTWPSPPALAELGAGEREAILLMQAQVAEFLLIDDDEGRRVARVLGCALTGTLGVLEHAAERDLIDLPTALTALQATNFYVRQELIDALLARDAARKRRTPRPDHP